jgi:hypothetical protein
MTRARRHPWRQHSAHNNSNRSPFQPEFMWFLGSILFGATLCATCGGIAQGYLRSAGPMPVRFQLLWPVVSTPLPALEPPQNGASDASLTVNSTPELPTIAHPGAAPFPFADPRPADEIGNHPLPWTAMSPSVRSLPDSRSTPAISPQMLLHFFQPSGSNPVTIVTMTVPFSPPSASPARSSSAHYTSPPAP